MLVEKSISLLIMTRLAVNPGRPEQLVAVLQRRGEFNHETMGPESWPGACQLTVHGKVLAEEDNNTALYREIREELGGYFIGTRLAWETTAADNLVEIGRVDKPEKLIVHYAIEVPPLRLKAIWLNASSGGLRLVRESDLRDIQSMPNCFATKADGVVARLATAMFPDEIEAVKTAFAHFAKPV